MYTSVQRQNYENCATVTVFLAVIKVRGFY